MGNKFCFRPWPLALPFITVLGATALRLAFDPWLGQQIPYTAFLLAIVVTARYAGFMPAVMATVLSALSANWFFIEPRHTLRVAGAVPSASIVFFGLIGLGTARLGQLMQKGRKLAEAAKENRALLTEVLRVLNRGGDVQRLLAETVQLIRDASGFDAVGLRLRQGLDFPYIEQQGFSDEFIQKENYLCANDGRGAIIRDKQGRPVLECTCGLVLSGEVDHTMPCFTRGGSFWTNASRDLLSLPSEGDPRTNPRNQCIHTGYQSVGLFPLRAGPDIVGILQLNDRKKGRFTADLVGFYESIAQNIGLALQRAQAESEVRESEERLARAQEMARLGSWELDTLTNRLTWSDEVYRIFGLSPREFPATYQAFLDAVHPDDRAAVDEAYSSSIRDGRDSYEVEHRVIQKATGQIRVVREKCEHIRDAAGRITRSLGMVHDITEARRAEEELRRNAEQFRIMGEVLPYGVWWCNEHGETEYVSQSYLDLIEMTMDEMRDLEWTKRLPPEEVGPMLDKWLQCVKTGEDWDSEHHVLGPDGKYHAVLSRGRPVRTPEGKIIGWAGINLDIDDRKRVEQALRENEARLLLTFDKAGVGIVEAEEGDRLVAANDRACEILGYSRDELLMMTVDGLTYPEDRALSAAVNSDVHSGRRDRIAYEKRYRRKDGSAVWVNVTVSAVKDERGRWVRSVATIEDISQRKQAQEALMRSEERYRRLVEQAPDAIFINRDDKIVLVNPSAVELFGGKRAEEFLGRSPFELIHPDYHAIIRDRLSRVLEGRQAVPLIEEKVVRLDGTLRDVEVAAAPIMEAEGPAVQVVMHDVTDRKRAEADLRKAVEELREADRRKDEFLAMLAHELRNPMSTISAAATLMKRLELPPQAEMARDAMDRQTKQLGKLVNDLLDVSRITRGKVTLEKENLDLREPLERALEIAKPAIERSGQKLSVELPEESLLTCGDQLRLQQIFTNLVSNAARYTPPGGEIAVSSWRVGTTGFVKVKDTGVGIDEHLQQSIFEPFMQINPGLSRSRGGLGVGLTIVKRLTELHGGTVSVYSEGKGRGSAFTVSLPLSTTAEQGAAAQPGVLLKPGLKVLVVDDNRDAAVLTAAILDDAGHDATIAYDGESGLKLALQTIPDVILLDIGLPGLDGYEVARRLRAAGLKATAIVAVTGYGQERDRRMSREAGFDAHLLKPLQYEALVPILADWQQSERADEARAQRQEKSPEAWQ